MGMKERRRIEIAQMKRKIRDAAIELIEQQGYEQLSLRKIAAKIEYSPTTIYLYYKDKSEIIADITHQLYQKAEQSAAAVIDSSGIISADKKVPCILKSFILSLCEEPEMAKAIMYSNTKAIFANESGTDIPANPGITMFDKILSDGIAGKVLKPTAENASWMLISALIGFVMSAIENHLYQLEHFDELADNFVEILMGGLRQ